MTNRIETPFADESPKLSINQKALKINFDPLRYGAFAEIGAGQEVARWLFKVRRRRRRDFQVDVGV